jgi:hypothetical protein
MKSLLVLGQSSFQEAVRSALDAASYRILGKTEPGQADPLLRLGFTDIVVVEAQSAQPQLTSFLARVRRRMAAWWFMLRRRPGKMKKRHMLPGRIMSFSNRFGRAF